MKKILLLRIIALLASFGAWAQVQSGIGTTQPTTTLEVIANASNNNVLDGITIPKLTCVEIVNKQLNATPNYGAAQAGTIVYITDVAGGLCSGAPVTEVATRGAGFYVFNGTEFIKIALDSGAATAEWQKLGNSNTDPSTDFVGTTDAQPLVLRTNSVEALRILINGHVGVGTATPEASLQVAGKPTDNTVADGVILPALTGDQLALKTINNAFTAAQTGALLYVTAAPTGTPPVPAAASQVNAPGFYFWDAAQWLKIIDTNSSFYAADGTLTSDRAVTQGSFNLSFDGNTLVVDGDGDNVGIGTNTIDPSAKLEIVSNSKGVLFPRLTTAERNAITDPAKGLMIYNLDEDCLQVNVGDTTTPDWNCVSSQGQTVPPLTLDPMAANGFAGVYLPGAAHDAVTGAPLPTIRVAIQNNQPIDATFTPTVTDFTFSAGGLVVNGMTGGDVLGTAYTITANTVRVFEYTLIGNVPSTTLTASYTNAGITADFDLVIPANLFTYKQLYHGCTSLPANATGYSDFEVFDNTTDTTATITLFGGLISGEINLEAVSETGTLYVAAMHNSATANYKMAQPVNDTMQRQHQFTKTNANTLPQQTIDFDLAVDAPDVTVFTAWIRGGGGGGGGAKGNPNGQSRRGGGGAGGSLAVMTNINRAVGQDIVRFRIPKGGNPGLGRSNPDPSTAGGSGTAGNLSYIGVFSVNAFGGNGGRPYDGDGTHPVGGIENGRHCSVTVSECYPGEDGEHGGIGGTLNDGGYGQGGSSPYHPYSQGGHRSGYSSAHSNGSAGYQFGGGGGGGNDFQTGQTSDGGRGADGNGGIRLHCPSN